MNKKNEQARKELDAILAGLMTDKKRVVNDKKLLAIQRATESNKKLKEQDPVEYFNKRSKIVKDAYKNPETQLNFKLSIQKRNEKDGYHDMIKTARGIEARSEEGRARRRKQGKEFFESERGDKLRQEQSKRASAKARPIVTPEGIFRSMAETINYYIEHQLVTNKNPAACGHKIRAWIKDKPTEYYYITKEEYIMLTGKEL